MRRRASSLCPQLEPGGGRTSFRERGVSGRISRPLPTIHHRPARQVLDIRSNRLSEPSVWS